MNECPNASLWYQLWLYLSKFEGDIVLPDQFALAYYIFGMKKETLLETQPQSDDVVDAAVVSVKRALDTLKERKAARKVRNACSTAPLKKHQSQNQFRPLQALGEKERYSYHEVDVSATTKSAIPKKPRPYPSRLKSKSTASSDEPPRKKPKQTKSNSITKGTYTKSTRESRTTPSENPIRRNLSQASRHLKSLKSTYATVTFQIGGIKTRIQHALPPHDA